MDEPGNGVTPNNMVSVFQLRLSVWNVKKFMTDEKLVELIIDVNSLTNNRTVSVTVF